MKESAEAEKAAAVRTALNSSQQLKQALDASEAALAATSAALQAAEAAAEASDELIAAAREQASADLEAALEHAEREKGEALAAAELKARAEMEAAVEEAECRGTHLPSCPYISPVHLPSAPPLHLLCTSSAGESNAEEAFAGMRARLAVTHANALSAAVSAERALWEGRVQLDVGKARRRAVLLMRRGSAWLSLAGEHFHGGQQRRRAISRQALADGKATAGAGAAAAQAAAVAAATANELARVQAEASAAELAVAGQ